MSTIIVIPARKGSTRFPNKPMALVAGRPLLYRTWQIAKAVKRVSEVYIATDDEEIRQFAEGWGAKVIMTPVECENGTLRVHAALQQLKEHSKHSPNGAPQAETEIAINLQGDAVLTPPWVVQAVVDELQQEPHCRIATPATQLDWKRYDEFLASKTGGRVSGTLVVFDQKRNALYFSKGLIPFVRERGEGAPPIYRHIGLYGYRVDALEEFAKLPPTPLEKIEKLEQLRALESGIPIRIVPVDYQGRTHWSIDNPEDVAVTESILKREGELIP